MKLSKYKGYLKYYSVTGLLIASALTAFAIGSELNREDILHSFFEKTKEVWSEVRLFSASEEEREVFNCANHESSCDGIIPATITSFKSNRLNPDYWLVSFKVDFNSNPVVKFVTTFTESLFNKESFKFEIAERIQPDAYYIQRANAAQINLYQNYNSL
jgi:hypothetical protein